LKSIHEIFRQYFSERRDQQFDGYRREDLQHLIRHRALEPDSDGFVLFADLPAGQEARWITEQIEFFSGINQKFEWKVYDLDRPSNLRQLLEERRFIAEEPEAFMVFPLTEEPPSLSIRHDNVRVEKIGLDRLKDIISVQEQLFRTNFAGHFRSAATTLATRPEELSFYCAYLDDRPVGTGWSKYYPGSTFVDLHGGGVIQELRGKGIYSRLFHARLLEARERGFHYLAVDAAPMSRPILERKGFIPICTTYPMRVKT